MPPNGGPQALAENPATGGPPVNPSDDGDGDGYTNLEEWLHAKAAQVEGAPTYSQSVSRNGRRNEGR